MPLVPVHLRFKVDVRSSALPQGSWSNVSNEQNNTTCGQTIDCMQRDLETKHCHPEDRSNSKSEHTTTLMVLFPYLSSAETAARSGPSSKTVIFPSLSGLRVSRWWISTSEQNALGDKRQRIYQTDTPQASQKFGVSSKITSPPVSPSGISSRLHGREFNNGQNGHKTSSLPELHIQQTRNPALGDRQLNQIVLKHEMIRSVRID